MCEGLIRSELNLGGQRELKATENESTAQTV